ncbi:ATP-binding protein [Nocardioides yefusunii]|uniref:histidine kinase n=1 Tax=Nocardioides yefusunii TaxID=2500546 RepID=A0ABW1QZQ8_9ACTN|nr:ATP-binding protein [Nocardioides yefusunii]
MDQTADDACSQPEHCTNAHGGILFDALMRDTALAIAVTDAFGIMTMMSPTLEDLAQVRFAPGDAARCRFRVRSADGSRLLDRHEDPFTRARAGEAFRDELVSLLREDGTLRFLRCSGGPLRDRRGAPLGGIVLFNDVTGEYEATRDQEMLRDRLVETFNHELRTPLTSLLGHAEVLEDLSSELVAVLPVQAVRSLTAVRTAVRTAGERLRHIADTVTDLVDLQSAGRVKRQPIEVADLADQVVQRHRARSRADVQVVLAAPRAVVEVDVVQTRRALSALVDNAVRHTDSGTAVEVQVRVAEDQLVMEVADRGPGIPVRERARLLQPFERGDTDLTSPAGRGLGLAVARSVALAHGGSLKLEDNSVRGLRAVLRIGLP